MSDAHDFAYPRLFTHTRKVGRVGCPPIIEEDGCADLNGHADLCNEKLRWVDPSTQETHYWRCTRSRRVAHGVHIACDLNERVVVARWVTGDYLISEEDDL